MTEQSRVWKVLVMLLVSMTVGTIVLMSLGNTPPVSGAFSLASYYRLTPVSQAIASRSEQHPDRWEQIEIVYSRAHLQDAGKLNAHFVVRNGMVYELADGEIHNTERWQDQASAQSQRNWGATTKTIVIMMIVDEGSTLPTNNQWSRVDSLIHALQLKFDISPDHILWRPDEKS